MFIYVRVEDKSIGKYISAYTSTYEVFELSVLVTFLFAETKYRSNLVKEGFVLVPSLRI